MTGGAIIHNPIGWVQVRLMGGWRRHFTIALVWAGAILVFSVLIYRAVSAEVTRAQFAGGAMNVLIFIQALLFLVVGTGAIRRAVQRDFNTDMISSHRQTAMSGAVAALGYLTGPLAQVWALTVVNLLACTICAVMTGTGPSQKVYAPAILFALMASLAAMCWSLGLLVALATRGKVAVIGLIVLVGISVNSGSVFVLPGLMLLVAIGNLGMIGATGAAGISDSLLPASVTAQIALSLTFFLAATRKFRRDDVPAFTPMLAFIVLALCTVICAAGFLLGPDDPGLIGRFFSGPVRPPTQFLATLTALALLACLPIAAVAREEAEDATRRRMDPLYSEPRPRPYWEGAVIAWLVVVSILLLILPDLIWKVSNAEPAEPLFQYRGLYVAVSLLLALLVLSALFRYSYAITRKGMLVALLGIALLWAVPPFADLAWRSIQDPIIDLPKTMLFTASPVGLWISALTDPDAPLFGGLLIHAGLAAAAILMARSVRRRAAVKTSPVPHAAGDDALR